MAEIEDTAEELSSVTLKLTADEAAVLRCVTAAVEAESRPGKLMRGISTALSEVFPDGVAKHKALKDYTRDGRISFVAPAYVSFDFYTTRPVG